MNNNVKSEKLTFIELINRYRIEIPIIQRDYAQGRDGKEELRKSFLNALLDADKDKPLELDFVYGSVNNGILQPLDGQQRLTTLFLLHWFVALKENKLGEIFKTLFSKFSYETRTSSRDFCFDLINQKIDYSNNQRISDTIIDCSWFFLSWKRDPTIKSMLTMLDAIQDIFKDKIDVWGKLNNISFHFVELQNFGLSDDLYIKMNARGKALTPFENFKAKFEQLIEENDWEKNLELEKTFSYLLDTTWTDLFWNYKDDKSVFDEQIFNFFKLIALFNYSLIKGKEDNLPDDFKSNFDLLQESNHITFDQLLKLGCFNSFYFQFVRNTLTSISELSNLGGIQKIDLKKYLSDENYIDEIKLFEKAIKFDRPNNKTNISNLTYEELIKLYAFYKYIANQDSGLKDSLNNWMRVIRNLVEGTIYNKVDDFVRAILSVDILFEEIKKTSIIEFLKEENLERLDAFNKEQFKEEKEKAKLISHSEEWKESIIEIENHGYFTGQIGFLLDWCKDENGYYLEKFKEYSEKVKKLFNDDGLKKFDNFLFERALFTFGNYLLKKGQNYSFLINSDRDISWKRLLRDSNENKRELLKNLLDKIEVTTLEKDLIRIIEDFTDNTDWKFHFIKQPEIILACGTNKFIRKHNDYDILLLNSTTTSGYHCEYYSYSLFLKLKDKLSLNKNSYKEKRSIDEWKYFEIKGKQIAFDCKIKKYIWKEENNEKWKEFLSLDIEDIKYEVEKISENELQTNNRQ